MEQDGRLTGQYMFMKTVGIADAGRELPALTMNPVSITPELKRQGQGRKLLDFCLEKAAAMGFGAVLSEGSIRFCSHCGFGFTRRFGIRCLCLPEDADDSFFTLPGTGAVLSGGHHRHGPDARRLFCGQCGCGGLPPAVPAKGKTETARTSV